MTENRGIVYLGPVQEIKYPKLANPKGKKIDHAAILKVVSTNICGSDQHMVRGRTTGPRGLVLGHEITGEVIEATQHRLSDHANTFTDLVTWLVGGSGTPAPSDECANKNFKRLSVANSKF